ncbi:unnamed protein product [Diabrotica balteata]|uniref:Uncharacterized protein n=1 Tax=Diabrotica balteata TaxID=107213 RepID=A0A9N9X5L5_DIABA|nr:unnamed protein product [Diabrotica balteata]
MENFIVKNNINDTLEDFNNIIIQSTNQFIGKTKPPKNHTPVAWWNPDCSEAIRASKKAFDRYKKTLKSRE